MNLRYQLLETKEYKTELTLCKTATYIDKNRKDCEKNET